MDVAGGDGAPTGDSSSAPAHDHQVETDDQADADRSLCVVLDDDTIAAAREIQRKAEERRKTRMRRVQDRRRALDAAERRQQELMEEYQEQLIAASLDVLELTKALLDLVEVLPREEEEQQKGDGHQEGEERGGDGPAMVITNIFLFHVFESICSRLGIILQRRNISTVVGSKQRPSNRKEMRGQSNLNPKHRSVLSSLTVEVPTDVINALQVFLALHVVPRPVTVKQRGGGVPRGLDEDDRVEESRPNVPPTFNLTSDDDIWDSVVRSTREWLAIIHVDEDLFNLTVYRQLLERLAAYSVRRLTRVVREVTRDFVSVIKSAGDAASLTMEETHGALNMSRAASSLSTEMNGSLRTVGNHKVCLASLCKEPTLTPQRGDSGAGPHPGLSPIGVLVGQSAFPAPASQLPPRHQGACAKSKPRIQQQAPSISAGSSRSLVTLVPPPSSPKGPPTRGGGAAAQHHGGIIIGATFSNGSTPPRRSAFASIIPQRSLVQRRDTEILPGVAPLEFGIEVGEPPIAATQAKVVLQAKCSHFLHAARKLPVPQVSSCEERRADHKLLSTSESTTSSTLPQHLDFLQGAAQRVHQVPATPPQQHTDEVPCTLRRAVESRTCAGGRIRAERNAAEIVAAKARKLSLGQQRRSTLAVSCAKELTFPPTKMSLSGGVYDASMSVVVSRGCLPRDDDPAISWSATRSAAAANEWHMCLPRDATAQWLRTSMATSANRDVVRNSTSPECTPLKRAVASCGLPDDQPTGCTTLRDRLATPPPKSQSRGEGGEIVPYAQGRTEGAPRRTARYATLLALSGTALAQQVDEPLSVYWRRLQALEFKLAVLRASHMPAAELVLWKQLWCRCHDSMESVFAMLKANATNITAVKHSQSSNEEVRHDGACASLSEPSPAVTAASQLDDILTEPLFAQAISGAAVASALEHRLDELMKALREREEEGLQRVGAEVPPQPASLPLPRFAQPIIVRKELRMSGAEKRFAALGSKAYAGVSP